MLWVWLKNDGLKIKLCQTKEAIKSQIKIPLKDSLQKNTEAELSTSIKVRLPEKRNNNYDFEEEMKSGFSPLKSPKKDLKKERRVPQKEYEDEVRTLRPRIKKSTGASLDWYIIRIYVWEWCKFLNCKN